MHNRLLQLAVPVVLLVALSAFGSARAQQAPDPAFEAKTIDDVAIGYGLQIGDGDGDGDLDVLLADKSEIVWYGRRF